MASTTAYLLTVLVCALLVAVALSDDLQAKQQPKKAYIARRPLPGQNRTQQAKQMPKGKQMPRSAPRRPLSSPILSYDNSMGDNLPQRRPNKARPNNRRRNNNNKRPSDVQRWKPRRESPRIKLWNKLANQAPGSQRWENRRALCRHELRRKCTKGQLQMGRIIDLGNGKTSACCRSITKRQAMSLARRQCRRRGSEAAVSNRCPSGFVPVGKRVKFGTGSSMIVACCTRDRRFGRDSELPGLVSICRARGGNALRTRCRSNERRLGRKLPFGRDSRRRAVCCSKRSSSFADKYAEDIQESRHSRFDGFNDRMRRGNRRGGRRGHRGGRREGRWGRQDTTPVEERYARDLFESRHSRSTDGFSGMESGKGFSEDRMSRFGGSSPRMDFGGRMERFGGFGGFEGFEGFEGEGRRGRHGGRGRHGRRHGGRRNSDWEAFAKAYGGKDAKKDESSRDKELKDLVKNLEKTY